MYKEAWSTDEDGGEEPPMEDVLPRSVLSGPPTLHLSSGRTFQGTSPCNPGSYSTRKCSRYVATHGSGTALGDARVEDCLAARVELGATDAVEQSPPRSAQPHKTRERASSVGLAEGRMRWRCVRGGRASLSPQSGPTPLKFFPGPSWRSEEARRRSIARTSVFLPYRVT